MAKISTLPPGPSGYWLLGSLHDFRRDMLAFFTKNSLQYQDIWSMHLGMAAHVVVNHPDLIHQVLVSDNNSYGPAYFNNFLRFPLGNGLLTNDGKSWLRQRRLIQPMFQKQRLGNYTNTAAKITERFLDSWQEGECRNVHNDMMHVTMQIMSQVLFGMDLSDEAEIVEQACLTILADFKFRLETKIDLPYWLPTPWNWKLHRDRSRLHELIDRIIADRRNHPGQQDDLLTRLLAAHSVEDPSGMSGEQIRDELITMLVAGHETTANTITWTLFLLAKHEEVQEQVVDEIQSVVRGEIPSADELQQLTWTEQVLMEAMRLYPAAYTIGRTARHEVALGGFRLPARCVILMSQWATHRDPRFFDNPNEFLPQRWRNGPRGLPDRAFFPFGAGPRRCIGQHFAGMESMIVLATLFRRYRLVLSGNKAVLPWPSITLRPKYGLHVGVQVRQQK
ncbi:MAG: cytochrome P450 [Gemmataceae bacterium]